ncbi:hypothetical protein [Paenibacillus thiaminolyticus]|uniref:hypothetical protein n=1 Tax=Paenibacillus thiaminolyticus TaxID=49283 RepID=UPI0037CAC762
MLDRALAAGVTASYVLMDCWFTHAPFIGEVAARGLNVIGMVKNGNERFVFSRYLHSAGLAASAKHRRSLLRRRVIFPVRRSRYARLGGCLANVYVFIHIMGYQ